MKYFKLKIIKTFSELKTNVLIKFKLLFNYELLYKYLQELIKSTVINYQYLQNS
jgi:hypothetical protein